MGADDETSADQPAGLQPALERLRASCLARWRAFPAQRLQELDALLREALEQAGEAEAEILTVMNPVTRPLRLRLAVLVTDAGLDTMYSQEWAELSASHDGRCFLVYRRRNGADYAIGWTAATSLPESMTQAMPEVLAMAMLEGDADDPR